MVFCLPLAHIPSCLTQKSHGRGDVNPVDLSEVGSGHARVPRPSWFCLGGDFPALSYSGYLTRKGCHWTEQDRET